MITVGIAALAVLVAVGGWIGAMRAQREDDYDIARFVLTIPADSWREDDK